MKSHQELGISRWGVMLVALSGIHVWHMSAKSSLVEVVIRGRNMSHPRLTCGLIHELHQIRVMVMWWWTNPSLDVSFEDQANIVLYGGSQDR